MTSMRNVQDVRPVNQADMTNPTRASMSNSPSQHLNRVPNQQDLIQLLAQHFNNQFYQLTQNADANSNDLVGPITQNNISQYQQHLQNGFQHSLELANQYSEGVVDLAGSLNSAQPFANPFSRPNQVQSATAAVNPNVDRIRPATSTKSADASQAMDSNPSLAEPEAPPAPTSNTINDMNLFNALHCFNLTNDQFVLSLHQQYLLQAANAARHYGFKDLQRSLQASNLNQTTQLQHQNQNQQHQHQHQPAVRVKRNQSLTKSSSKNLVHLGDAQEEKSRNLLKFSINTILGRGSPGPVGSSVAGIRATADESSTFMAHDEPVDSADKSTESRMNANELEDGRPRQLSSPERDPNVTTDFSNESSPTQTPIPHAGSIISGPSLATYNPYQSGCGPSALDHQNVSDLSDQVARLRQQQAIGVDPSRPMVQSQHPHHASLSFLASSTSFPWTVAARGKPRRGMMRRAVFSDSQRVGLEKRFQIQKYISKPDRKKLADKLGLRDSQVKIWFQNRRMKWRNSKERELLSAGGSREQTLPTRNNPNPDLSDVGETIKKATTIANDNNTV